MPYVLVAALLICAVLLAVPEPNKSRAVIVSFGERLGPMEIDRMGLGQGGLSDEPIWETRISEVRALRPKLIRLFIQEYFDLLPAHGKYHFDTLDRSVDTILKTGAQPLMCICLKPKALFPKVDQDVVEPTDYAEWERLLSRMVERYRSRGVHWWEISNEPDIGESGGCPYRFQLDSYVRYYRHSVAAITRTDAQAKVGGPALAGVHSPILPALLEACERDRIPLHFVSWHIYSSDPQQVRGTIDYAHELLAKHPSLHPETVLDEWNMDLQNPPQDARFQPCYVLETVWQMKEGGLDWSCYYQIRDRHVEYEQFAPFMSPEGTAFMTRWWNRMPQFDGLFDFQDRVRPAYFAWKLLARMTGERVALHSGNPSIHGFATHDEKYRILNVLLWNFSDQPAETELGVDGLHSDVLMRQVTLDATAPSDDENSRLRPEPPQRIPSGAYTTSLTLPPYGIRFWSFE